MHFVRFFVRFLPCLAMALMVLSLSFWVLSPLYVGPTSGYGSHSHDGDSLHSHAAETSNAEIPSKFTAERNEKKLFLPDYYVFVVLYNPIFSIERPPESALL